MATEKELISFFMSGLAFTVKNLPAPHPPWWGKLIRYWLALSFPIAGHLLYDLTIVGLENFTNSPGTLIIANHKTDFDIVLLAPAIFWSHRGRGPAGRIAFVAAERMFLPGYLSDYILHRPEWLRRLIYPANLSAVLKAIRAYPIGYLRSRKLKAHLLAALETAGDIPIGAALSKPVNEVIPGAPPDTPISRIFRWKYHTALDSEWEFSVLSPKLRRELRARHIDEIISSLSRFAAVLDEGDAVYLAPEGGLETDGRFDEAKAGLSRLIAMTQDPIVLPVNLTYDFMNVGRQSVFITIGEEMSGMKSLPTRRIEQEVIDAVTRLGTITFSQLAARGMRRLAKSDPLVHAGDLRQEIIREATRLADVGYRVDPNIFNPAVFRRRWDKFVTYCTQKELLRFEGPWILYDRDFLFAEHVAGRVSPWEYAANELHAILFASRVPETVH